MKHRMPLSSLVALIALIVLGLAPVSAQQATPGVSAAPTGILGQFQVDALPSPNAEVWFIRIFLDPAGVLPLDLQIGPTVLVVESGTLTVSADKPIEVSGGSPATPVAAGPGAILDTAVASGHAAFIHENTTISLRNDGAERTAFLALLVFSPEREVESMQNAEQSAAAGTPPVEPHGFSQQPLGVGPARFPAGPGVITIERVALASGQKVSTDLTGGAMAGGVERGDVQVALDSGTCYLWPAIMQAGDARNKQIGAGESVSLPANDGFGCFDGVARWQGGSQGATIIRAVVLPLSPATPIATPAA